MDGKVRLGFHQVTTKDANATFDKVADTAQGMNVIVRSHQAGQRAAETGSGQAHRQAEREAG